MMFYLIRWTRREDNPRELTAYQHVEALLPAEIPPAVAALEAKFGDRLVAVDFTTRGVGS